jgi:hypothetical protein
MTQDAARAEERIARILAAKGRDALSYLKEKGRGRFLRELQADGVPLATAAAILDRAEKRLSSEELAGVLADLAARLRDSG